MRLASLLLLACLSMDVLAEACLIESSDDQLPVRMCQQNISIPANLFRDSFCQPQIPDRSFEASFVERCPEGAYGICDSARSEGVAYRQSIHYYSEPDDRPLLQTWCEQFNDGQWRTPDSE